MARSYLDATEHPLLITSLLFLFSLIITFIYICTTRSLNYQIYLFLLTIVLYLLTFYSFFAERAQARLENEIRLYERSLETFYRPLQCLFFNCIENPMKIYEEKSDEFKKIGFYRHYAKKEARRLYETTPVTNDTLYDLIVQVENDIEMFQNRLRTRYNE